MIRFNFKQLVYSFAFFALGLCSLRILRTGSPAYVFLVWNLFLAFVPWWISSALNRSSSLGWRHIPVLLAWLLFLPNAPYLLTDLFHLKQRAPIPLWFDLILILSFAFIGLLLFYRSLKDVFRLLERCVSPLALNLITYAVFWLISFGLYLGRFLRFNSWDVMHPLSLGKSCWRLFRDGHALRDMSAFTLLFSAFLMFLFLAIARLGKEEAGLCKE